MYIFYITENSRFTIKNYLSSILKLKFKTIAVDSIYNVSETLAKVGCEIGGMS